MLVCQMIEGAPFSQFLYFNIGLWVFRFNYNQQPNQYKLKCNNCQTKSILFFNKFRSIFFCLFDSKMKKNGTKYVVCYSNYLCFKTKILELIIKCGSRRGGGGTGGPDPPPGKSQVIWVSIGNEQLDPPGKSWTPPPLEKVGPPLEKVGPPLEC